MTRQAASAASRCRAGLLGGLALGWALAGPVGAAAPADRAAAETRLAMQAPGPAVVAAQQRLDTAQALLRQAGQALGETERLQDRLGSIDRLWQQGADAEHAAQAAVQVVDSQALPDLRAAHQAWLGTAADVNRLTARHQAAVAAVARAPAQRRAAAMAEADAQARARAGAERAHQAARQRHRQAIAQAWLAVDRASDRRADLQRIDDALAVELADAAQDWTAVDARWRALQRAVAAPPAARPPLATPGGLSPALAPWPVPARAVAAATSGHLGGALDDWRAAAGAMEQAQDAAWLRSDAAAFVRQTLAAPGNCPSAACAAWQAEQGALATELATLAATLADTGARLGAAQAQADALPAGLTDPLAQASARRQALAGAVAGALDRGQPALRALAAAGQQALSDLEDARQQAKRDFTAAWRAQYGQDPPEHFGAMASAPAMAAAPPSMAAAGMAMPLRQHALHRMTQRNDEPTGFGAYTYVVVGTGAGLGSDGVRRRLARLLATLQNLTPAEQVEAEQRLLTNVFVVPVQAGSPQQGSLAYELRLAQALMSHVPPALLMPGRLQRALLTSNGPFLITLPGRLADAQANWPVLFADLNSVPEAVVADVVHSYMGDLLVGFQASATGWKPPPLQRVALTLVRLVQGTGEVVMAAFPASLAAPAPR